MFTWKFWKDALERTISTTAQSIILYVGGDLFNAWDFEWRTALGVASGAGFLTLLKSIAASQLVNKDENSASLVSKEA